MSQRPPVSPRVEPVGRHLLRSSLLATLAAFVALQGPLLGQASDSRLGTNGQTADVNALLAEQARRIDRLEAFLAQLGGAQGQTVLEAFPCMLDGDDAGWRSARTWNRLSVGMSEANVVAILGRPLRVESGPADRTLVYEQVDEQGEVRVGRVRIVEGDWVQGIHPPEWIR